MVERRPEGLGGRAVTATRQPENIGLAASIRELGGLGRDLIKKHTKDAISRGIAKEMVGMGNELAVSRAKAEGNGTRFGIKNKYIEKYLKGGGNPEVAVWLQRNMTHQKLTQVLGRDNIVRLTDEQGSVWGEHSQRVKQPQTPEIDKGQIEDALKFEQDKNTNVSILAPKSTKAFAAFGSGLDNVNEYVVEGGELTDRVSDVMTFIMGKKGQILYRDITSTGFINVQETKNLSMLKSRLEGVFSEFLPMIARAIDDPKNTVNPGSAMQFSRSLKGDLIDQYNNTPGARLAFGENFIDEVNIYFDGVHTRIDRFLTGQFEGTSAKTTLDKLKMTEQTVKLTQSLAQMDIWNRLPIQLQEIDVMGDIMQAMVNLTKAMGDTGGVAVMREGFNQALAKHMRHTIESTRNDLRNFAKKGDVPAGGARIEDLIEMLLSNPVYINMGGDMDGIIEEITSVINKVKMSPSKRSEFNASIKEYTARATKAGPPMKTWLDSVQDYIGEKTESGSALMQKLINKIWSD